MQQIKRGIFYEDAYLGVTLGAIISAQGTILIDAPLRAEDARAWRSALLNQRAGSNRLLVNLDSHPDRTLGARSMDCTIIAHQKTAQAFRNRPTIFKGQTAETGAVWESYDDAIGMRWAIPDITFTHQMTLYWGGPEVVMEHHPGPTSGAIWASVPAEGIVFVGDAVVVNQPPFLANAELEAWVESLELLLNVHRNDIIISGRGGPASMETVQTQLRVIKTVLKGVEQLARQNAPPEATEELIPPLLSMLSYPPEMTEAYHQRLLHGLSQCYSRRYHAVNSLEEPSAEEGVV